VLSDSKCFTLAAEGLHPEQNLGIHLHRFTHQNWNLTNQMSKCEFNENWCSINQNSSYWSNLYSQTNPHGDIYHTQVGNYINYIYNIIYIYYIYIILPGKPIWRPWRSGLISRTCQKITVFWCWPWLKLITNANRKKNPQISVDLWPPHLRYWDMTYLFAVN